MRKDDQWQIASLLGEINSALEPLVPFLIDKCNVLGLDSTNGLSEK
jgi:hypothetical protein